MILQRLANKIFRYFSSLSNGRITLWCYLIWYFNTVLHHFEPSPSIWLNSIGISALIGVALILSIGGNGSIARDKWQTFRLFAMPFCVSSFSSIIKDKGFFLIFPPAKTELAIGVALCATFALAVICLRRKYH